MHRVKVTCKRRATGGFIVRYTCFFFFKTACHNCHLKISCHLPLLSSFEMMITPSTGQAHVLTENQPLFLFLIFFFSLACQNSKPSRNPLFDQGHFNIVYLFEKSLYRLRLEKVSHVLETCILPSQGMDPTHAELFPEVGSGMQPLPTHHFHC